MGTVDCGKGRHCPAGDVCWSAPAAVGTIKKGELRCASPDAVANLEGKIALEKERAAAQKRWEDELRKAAAKKAEEEKKETARRKAEEKAQAAADAKFKTDRPARTKVSELLAKGDEERRLAELRKSAEVKKRELQEFLAEYGQKSPTCRLDELAYGSAAGKTCALREVQARPWPSVDVPPSQQLAQPSPTARQQFGATGRTNPSKTGGDIQSPPAPLTKQQYDHLKQNAAGLYPEQRKVSANQRADGPGPVSPSSSASTFTQNRSAPVGPPTERPVRLADILGPNANKVDVQIDKAKAQYVLPYAAMANDAYNAQTRPAALPAGITRLDDWEAVLRRSGVKQDTIDGFRSAGFSAAIYRNDRSGEVIVAFRGTEPSSIIRDWGTDVLARGGVYTKQYSAAAQLGAAVKAQHLGSSNVVLTGHSLGGGLASHASSVTGLDSIAFNAARNEFSTAPSTGVRLNVIAAADPIGTQYTQGPSRQVASGIFGDSSLPGTTMAVPATGNVPHGMDGLITALQGVAR